MDLRVPELAIVSVDPVCSDAGESLRQQRDRASESVTVPGADHALYDLRLFRDGNLVAEIPDREPPSSDAATEDLAPWRRATRIATMADGRMNLRLEIPLGTISARTQLAAYAFNADRIKSTTATKTYSRTTSFTRRRRAVVVAIGSAGNNSGTPSEPPLKWPSVDAATFTELMRRYLPQDYDLVSSLCSHRQINGQKGGRLLETGRRCRGYEVIDPLPCLTRSPARNQALASARHESTSPAGSHRLSMRL